MWRDNASRGGVVEEWHCLKGATSWCDVASGAMNLEGPPLDTERSLQWSYSVLRADLDVLCHHR